MSINKFNIFRTRQNNSVFCAKVKQLVFAENFYLVVSKNENFY